MRVGIRDFKIDAREFDKVLKQALTRAYSEYTSFESESEFKYELFHQLYALKVGGHRLGAKLPGHRTCMLHVEANAVNGLRGQSRRADLVLCDPRKKDGFNYQVKVVVELKKSLNSSELDSELKKFAGYNNKIPRLYIVSANPSRIDRGTTMRVVSGHSSAKTRINVLDRTAVLGQPNKTATRKAKGKTVISLVEHVTGCIKTTLELYGKHSQDPYHSFFWRNYEYETEKGWTFPSEGDFVAQLYHRLRLKLGRGTQVRPEYGTKSLPRSKVDMFVQNERESVGVEVKLNYDNFKGKGENAETFKLSRKFNAMSRDHKGHVNILVVIQGQHAHKGNNKKSTLESLRRQKAKFGLIYYDEIRKEAVGPVGFP